MPPLTEKDKKQLLGAAIFVAIAGAGAYLYYVHSAKSAQVTQMRQQIDSLSIQVDSAKRDLARGSVETLRQRVREYSQTVQLMRRLVPEGSEVPNLIDAVSSRAKRRGVQVAQFTPLGIEEGTPFQTHRYRFSVMGHYDQVGEFLSDVGSLPRIMVPYDITVAPANATAAKVYQDSSGSLLEVGFQLRSFVKSGTPADSTQQSGTE